MSLAADRQKELFELFSFFTITKTVYRLKGRKD